MIAFVGSVFSPYYAWSRRRDPLDHVALNVALYGRGATRWSLTERGKADLFRSPDALQIGPSALSFEGDSLQIEIDEIGCPLPRRVRGRVRLFPELRTMHRISIAADGGHQWWPIAPRARVEVSFDQPALRWSGSAYLDCNWGSEPLEQAFHSWSWARAPLRSGAVVLYDTCPRVGPSRAMALRFDKSGAVHPFPPPPLVELDKTIFRLPRHTRSEQGASLIRTLTDAHFYARSVVGSQLCGEPVVAIHESLSLDRFRAPWAKLLLPFRMPRNARRTR